MQADHPFYFRTKDNILLFVLGIYMLLLKHLDLMFTTRDLYFYIYYMLYR